MALIACAIIGSINGALAVFLKIPAFIVTLVTAILVQYLGYAITNGQMINIVSNNIRIIAAFQVGGIPISALVIIVIPFILAFLLILLTKLGVPTYKRAGKICVSHMLAYTASGAVAAVIGLYQLLRLGAANPTIGSGFEIFIIFVFACVISSRVIDGRFLPAVYAIVPALIFAFLSISLNILNINAFIQVIIKCLLTLAMLVIAYLSRIGSRTPEIK